MVLFDADDIEIKSLGENNEDLPRKTISIAENEKIIGLRYKPLEMNPELSIHNFQFMVSRPK